jgi:hypothetical protein
MKREINILLVNELRTSLEEFLYLIRHYDPKYEVVVEVLLLFFTLLYLFIIFTSFFFPLSGNCSDGTRVGTSSNRESNEVFSAHSDVFYSVN